MVAPNETAKPEPQKNFEIACAGTAKLATVKYLKAAPGTRLLNLKSAMAFKIAIVEK